MDLKKRLIAVAAVGAMAAALLYGSTREMGAQVEEEDLPWFSREETIYFWYTDESMTNFVNSAAVAFGEQEDIRVIPVLTSDSQYLEALNDASLNSDQVPDAYLISHDSLEKAYLAGLAEEVKDEMGVCTEANFPAAALSAVSYEGRTVGYPLAYETSVLMYNETYLYDWATQAATKELSGTEEDEEVLVEPTEEVQIDETLLQERTEVYMGLAIPSTVDDILQIADSFDVPEGVEGVFTWDVSDIFYNYWFVGSYMTVGGDAGDDKSNISINNAETIQCLEVYKALNQFFSIESDTVDYESVLQDFIDGKTVFTIVTSDAVTRLQEAQSNGEFAFDYGFATLPDVSEELQSRAMSVTSAVAVNSYSAHKEEANRFAAYLTSEYAASLYEMTGKAPANLHMSGENGPLQIFMQEYANSVPLPKMMETGNFWLQLERLFASVWNGSDVNEMVQELSDQITTQVHAEVQ